MMTDSPGPSPEQQAAVRDGVSAGMALITARMHAGPTSPDPLGYELLEPYLRTTIGVQERQDLIAIVSFVTGIAASVLFTLCVERGDNPFDRLADLALAMARVTGPEDGDR